jgi:hypothetical protein
MFVAGGSVVNIKNVLIQGSGSGDDYFIGTAPGILNTSSIMTSDASSPFTTLRNKIVSFQQNTPLDYRLSPLDVTARDAGTSLAAEAYYSFSFDSSFATRSVFWDIGSHEVTGSIVRYVNTVTGSDTTGTGFINAPWATLAHAESQLRGNYTAINCTEPDEQGNLTVAMKIVCTGSAADTVRTTFNSTNWTTNTTHRLQLLGESPGAYWSTGHYRLTTTDGAYGTAALTVTGVVHLLLTRMQIRNDRADKGTRPVGILLNNAAHHLTIDGGMVVANGTTGTYDGSWVIQNDAAGAVANHFHIRNVVLVNSDGQGVNAEYTTGARAYTVYNVTIVNRGSTARDLIYFDGDGVGDYRLKNVLLQGSSSGADVNYQAFTAADETATIITQDATSPQTNLRSRIVTFNDATNFDYRLANSDVEARDEGTNLSADSYWPFSTDGSGATRGGFWDVGAHEVQTTTVRYVNTSSTSGGSGKTNATSGTHRAYAGLAEAEAALRNDYKTSATTELDEQGNATIALQIICQGTTADSTRVNFGNSLWGTGTNSTHKVQILGESPGPYWSTSHYRMEGTAPYDSGMIQLDQAISILLTKLQVSCTSTRDQAPHALRIGNYAHNTVIDRGYYRNTGTTGTWDTANVIQIYEGQASTFKMRNVTVAAADGAAVTNANFNGSAHEWFLYNCTLINRGSTNRIVLNGINYDATGTQRVKNLIVQGITGSTALVNLPATFEERLKVLTQDTSSNDATLQGITLTFQDATNWDYRLISADSPATNGGLDLSADAYWPFSIDASGSVRTDPWSIGAYEFPGTGGSYGNPGRFTDQGDFLVRISPIGSTSFIFRP